eukprot:1301445-Karenia_brevis.AAC.1
MESFENSVHHGANRKAFSLGEIPNEVWRIVMKPQWVRPNFEASWGMGHRGEFKVSKYIHKMLFTLFATILGVKSMPVSTIVNEGVEIPKKIASIDHESQ